MKNQKLLVVALAFFLPFTAPAQTPGSAAELVLLTGVATVGARALSVGDKLNEGDTVVTGHNSYANLKFADGGRVLLRPNSEFTIEKYEYSPPPLTAEPVAAPVAQNAFFRLIRGGFRAISGAIKGDQQNYRVTTPTATIGIRGTDYEAQLCAEDCPPTDGATGAGLVVATNEGSVVLTTPRGEFIVDAGQVALAMANGQVFQLPAVPDLMLMYPATSPANCQ